MHRIRFRLGLRPIPLPPSGGAYSVPPDPHLELRGQTSKAKGRERDERKGMEWDWKEETPLQKS